MDSLKRDPGKKGRPLLRYKNILKRDLLKAEVNLETFSDIAVDQDAWQFTVCAGINTFEQLMRQKTER